MAPLVALAYATSLPLTLVTLIYPPRLSALDRTT